MRPVRAPSGTAPLALAVVLAAATAAAQEPGPRLAIHPAALAIDHSGDRPRVVIVATAADGTTRDVTAACTLAVEGEAVAAVTPDRRIEGVAEGSATLAASFEGARATAPVTVKAAAAPPPGFDRDVIPILTRQGCNSGGCHGAATGKNGFRLSLFGFDPARDHVRLTRELRGRRIDPAEPESSLVLRKPTLAVTHKGGQRLDKGGAAYATLARWIEEGAPPPSPAEAPLAGFEIGPTEIVLAGAGQTQRIAGRANYADGSDRDVTDLAILSSTNEAVAKVDGTGVITSTGPGEAFVLARFGTHAVVAQVLVLREGAGTAPPMPEPANDIDRHVFDKLRKLRIEPSPGCSDEAFVRRVHLDIVNLLPSAGEAAAFVADPAPDKRARLVDRLLDRPEFADVWAMHWAEVLRIESRQLKEKGMHHYTEWLRDAFRSGRPFDAVVREALTATGPSFGTPAANYWLIENDPKALAENAAQVFLGIRIQCAQCHNHPFERWTMDDYYGFAAFFAQVSRKTAEDTRERVVFDRGSGEVNHPRDGRVVPPKFLAGEAPAIPAGTDRRDVLARWLTSPGNPWFPAHVANRVFARFFGRGLVDPPDDVRVSNPPSHPELHRLLGRKLAEWGFDFKRLVREICASYAYQQAAREDGTPPSALAGFRLRRLTAEQMLDGIAQVTGVVPKFSGLPPGARAAEVPDGDPENAFLDVFGRPRRQTPALCERRTEPTLSQSLHLINGSTLDARIRAKDGHLHRMIAEGRSDAEIVEWLFRAALSRAPRAEELESRLAEISAAKDRVTGLEDLMWAVLNSKEFLFNR